MFAGDSQMLRNKRHIVISVIAINVFYDIGLSRLGFEHPTFRLQGLYYKGKMENKK